MQTFAHPPNQEKKQPKGEIPEQPQLRGMNPRRSRRQYLRTPLLNAPKEFTNGNFDRLRNPEQSFDGDDLLSALQFANIFWIQGDFFRQFLLSEIRPLPVAADRFTNHFPVRQNCFSFGFSHNSPKLGELTAKWTPATCWYFVFHRG